jgi:hypothetical protein
VGDFPCRPAAQTRWCFDGGHDTTLDFLLGPKLPDIGPVQLPASCSLSDTTARRPPTATDALDVCAWIGSSPAVANAHCLQVTEADFQRAAETKGGVLIAGVGATSGEQWVTKMGATSG